MKIYKDTWFIKDIETEEIFFRGESFGEVIGYCNNIVKEFETLADQYNNDKKGIFIVKGFEHSLPTIKQYVEDKKKTFENSYMICPYKNDSNPPSVWGLLHNGFKHSYMKTKPYYVNFSELVRGLYFRMGSALLDKSFVKLDGYRGREKLKEFGVEFVDAKFYDARFQHNEVILSIDQLNYVMLVEDKENPIIHSHVEIDEIHNDFVNNGLI